MRSEGFEGAREMREDSVAPLVLAKRAVKRPGSRVALEGISRDLYALAGVDKSSLLPQRCRRN